MRRVRLVKPPEDETAALKRMGRGGGGAETTRPLERKMPTYFVSHGHRRRCERGPLVEKGKKRAAKRVSDNCAVQDRVDPSPNTDQHK